MAKPDDKIGPYTLIRKLGRGAFGVVWLAEKRTVIATSKVALKFPNDEDIDLEAIKQEASLWIHASGHPNVLTFIDADVYDGQVVIVSEYAPDGSLSNWLETHGGKAPTIDAAVDMIFGILAGLEHLHKRGIIHRDIKPDNILLQNESPRLADFGIARILKTTSKSTVATGTPAYMPPEAFDGKRNEQTDIWSLGVIFYQLLTGTLPFPQTDMPSLLMAIVSREPTPLPASVPAAIRKVIGRTLEKDPAKRYDSAGEMRLELRDAIKIANGRPDESRGDSPPIDIADLPTQVAGTAGPASAADMPSTRQQEAADQSDANEAVRQYVKELERKAEEERRHLEVEEAKRKAEIRQRREQERPPNQVHVSTPHGPAPHTASQPVQPSIYRSAPRSKSLLWVVLSVSFVVILGVVLFLKFKADRNSPDYGSSTSNVSQNPATPGTSTPYPSQSTQPTPTPSVPSVAVRLRLVDVGASSYFAAANIDVSLESSTQNFSQRTDTQGFVTFGGVPCNEEIEISYRSDMVDRKLLRIKRDLSCGSALIDLGIYTTTLGERLGSTESDLGDEIRIP